MNSPPRGPKNIEPSPPTRRFSLKKKERLCGKTTFDLLFKRGNSFYEGPLRFVYTTDLPDHLIKSDCMIGVGAPKRLHRRANVRNLLKRRLREAVRLNKHPLEDVLMGKDKNLALLITYNSKKIHNFHLINEAVKKGFMRLEEKV